MKRIILLYIIFSVSNDSKVLTQEGLYISPGVQIGIDSKGNLHRAVQITLGMLIEEHPFTTGLPMVINGLENLINQVKKVGTI